MESRRSASKDGGVYIPVRLNDIDWVLSYSIEESLHPIDRVYAKSVITDIINSGRKLFLRNEHGWFMASYGQLLPYSKVKTMNMEHCCPITEHNRKRIQFIRSSHAYLYSVAPSGVMCTSSSRMATHETFRRILSDWNQCGTILYKEKP
jgi:hypothetical protein